VDHDPVAQPRVTRLLADYVKHRRTGLPYVTAKFAMSLDGKIATRTGDSRWVSGPETLAWVHQERTRLDAIAVGVNTVLVDDPQLTARPGGEEDSAHQPLRVVVDSNGRTGEAARVLMGGSRTLIATTDAAGEPWKQQMRSHGAEVAILPAEGGRVDLGSLIALLGNRGCLNVLVEGGGILLGSFFDAGLVDRVQAIVAPLIIGGREAPLAVAGRGVERMADAPRLRDVRVRPLGADTLIEGLLKD
jgi:diaminohydroxyphosphoribosylaminopyrimidine deaminase/5-amino-6-(5-phosphoribosylamino)uracil reductase